jgi:hypothetical protein
MEEFTPPVKERETEDLIYIYLSPKGDWQDEIVKQTIEELYKRGITEAELDTLSSNYKKRVEEEQREHQKELDKNATETYPIWKMILIFFATPFIFLSIHQTFEYMTVSDLKRENYKIKYKQRLFLLIGGGIFYLILFRFAFITRIS